MEERQDTVDHTNEPDNHYPPDDGPRYVASLAKTDDPCAFQDKFETEDLDLVKDRCLEFVLSFGRECIVWDRKLYQIIHRHKPTEDESTPKERKK